VARKWTAAAVVVAAALGGVWALVRTSSKPEESAAPTRTVVVRRGLLTHALRTSGEVRPLLLVELKSKASGQITLFSAVEGDAVDPKEILVKLDPILEERSHERAKANVGQARARRAQIGNDAAAARLKAESSLKAAREELAFREAELKRYEDAPQTVSQSAMEEARLSMNQAREKKAQLESDLVYLPLKEKTDVALADAEIKLAEIALQEAETRLADTQVRPPIKGILLKKMVEEGTIISSGISTVTGGTTLATIADLSKLTVIANVVESDIGKVRIGQEARLSVEAYPGRRFIGQVYHIPPQTEVEENVARFKVKIEVPGEAGQFLRVGMTADIELLIAEKPDVLKVPSEAVVAREGKKYLRRADGTTVEVTVGLDTGLEAEILAGVREGEEILEPVARVETPSWMRRR
jgi:HlyD family secretion protein